MLGKAGKTFGKPPEKLTNKISYQDKKTPNFLPYQLTEGLIEIAVNIN